MKTLDRKLLRELYRSKGLLLAITSIIAVGITCYITMQSAYQNLQQAKQAYYRQCRMADFWIDLKKSPLVEIEALSSLPGVTEIQTRIQFHATVDLPEVTEPLNALVLSLPPRRSQVINDIVMRQGGYFTDRRDNEVIISDSFARERGLHVGQSIHLLLNNRRQELFIVGTAISSEFVYMLGPGAIIPDPEHFGVFYVKQRFAEEVFDFNGAANQVVGRLSERASKHPDVVLRQAETMLEPFGVFAITPLSMQTSNLFLSNEIDGLGAIAKVIPTIFLVVAALVLNVLMTRMARRQRVEVGTLKAIGYSDLAVFLHFLKFGLCVGLAGGLLGSLLGYSLSAGMTAIYRFYFEFPDLPSRFYWYTNTVGMVVSLLCAMLGSFSAARGMLRLHPAEAMRPEPPQRGGTIWLERFSVLWHRLSAGWRTALRSLFRHRIRTAVGVFSAAMGAGLLVSGLMMFQSQSFLIDFQFYRVQRSDIDLEFEETCGLDALDEVKQLPGVDFAEPVLQVACTLKHGPYRRKGAITGLKTDARLTVPRDTRGQPIGLPESGLVVSRHLANILHLSAGDRLTMIPIRGQRRSVQLVVSKITDSYLGLTAYADIRFLSRAVGEEFAVTGAQLLTDGNDHHLTQLHRELKETPAVQSVIARRDMLESLKETLLKNQFVSIGVLILFSGVIFFGSMVNVSIVNLAQRQREVATYRALGYGTWQIGGMFFRESLLINLLGSLLGMPVGYLLVVLTAHSFENDLLRLPVVTAPWIWAFTLFTATVFAMAAQGVVQWSITRMNYLEALNVKE